MNIALAFIILLSYIIYIIKLRGSVPPSLSESIFDIDKKKRWLWSVVMFAICIFCTPTIIEKTSDNTRFIAFIAIASIAFVGAAPLCKYKDDSLQFNVHEKAAIISGVFSQIVIAFNKPILLCLWIIFFLLFTKMNKTKLFWAEMVCFSSMFLYCLI